MDRFTYMLLTGNKQYNLKEDIIAPFAIGYSLQHRRLEKNAHQKLQRRYLTRADLYWTTMGKRSSHVYSHERVDQRETRE
jgi:hypothetical protein